MYLFDTCRSSLSSFITLSIVLPLQDRFEHAKRIVCTVGGACGMVANSGLANCLPQFHKFCSTSSALRRCCLTLPLVALCGPHISQQKSADEGVKGHTVTSQVYMFEEITSSSWPVEVGLGVGPCRILIFPDPSFEVTFRAFAGTALCALVSRALLNMCGTSTKAWADAVRWLDGFQKRFFETRSSRPARPL